MKERRPENQRWYEQKLENAAHNRAMVHGFIGRTFYDHGQPKQSLHNLRKSTVIFERKLKR